MPEKTIYKETIHYDEDGGLINKTVSSPSYERTFGYMQVQPQSNDGLFTSPVITTTTFPDYGNLNPSINSPYNIPSWPTIPPSTYIPLPSYEDMKVTKRSEQMKMGKMSALKEFLDQFNTCKDFNDVYQVIDKMKEAYDLLDNELA